MTKQTISFDQMTAKEKKKVIADNYDKMKEKDAQLVRGKFVYHECPGGMLEFSYRKYKGEDIVKYQLIDGQIYSIPLGVAKHLNTNVAYPEYSYVQGEDMVQANAQGFDGNKIMKITKKVRRCSFQSLEFLDIDGFGGSDIVTVERVVA